MINRKDFEQLYDEYYSGLCAYAFRFVRSRAMAEDMVQDVFCQIWNNKKEISFHISGKSYLYLSVKNRCLDYIKHNNIHSRYEEIMKNGGEVSQNFTWEHFVEREMETFVESSLSKLPQDLRELFILNKIEGRTAQSIADEKGVSVRTIEGQIARSLKLLRENLSLLSYSILIFYIFIIPFFKKML